jgi:hypothetical protein
MSAPHAVQVADHFHLLRNLREALEHVLARHAPVLEQAFRQRTPSPVNHPPPAPPDPTLTGSQQISRERRQRRSERYHQVIELSAWPLRTAHRIPVRVEPKNRTLLAARGTISRAPSYAKALRGGLLALLLREAVGPLLDIAPHYRLISVLSSGPPYRVAG